MKNGAHEEIVSKECHSIIITGSEFDEAYDELLIALFGGSNEIFVKDEKNNAETAIQRRELQRLYRHLGLRKSVIKEIIKAHVTVLEHGFRTGNERVVVIDCKSGAKVVDKAGTPRRVVFRLSRKYKGELIAVHNHPNNTPFSPIDLHTFGSYAQIRCIVVQKHDGKVYALKKTADVEFHHTEDSLGALLDIIMETPANKGKTDIEIGEIFVHLVAKAMKWDFVGGELNG